MKSLAALALFAIAVASLASLVAGASFLEVLLPGGLPLGNALSALVLVSAALIPVLLSPPRSALRAVSLIPLVAAIAWLPVSIALAGNLELNFDEARGSLWQSFTRLVSFGVLGTLAWALVGHIIGLRRRNRSA